MLMFPNQKYISTHILVLMMKHHINSQISFKYFLKFYYPPLVRLRSRESDNKSVVKKSDMIQWTV